MAEYYLLEHPIRGAIGAMKASAEMTRFHRVDLFKLDLSFWWFYACEVLAAALCFLDLILPSLGVDLPLPREAVTFVCFGIYAAAQLALHYWRKNEVHVTYAVVYNTLMEEE